MIYLVDKEGLVHSIYEDQTRVWLSAPLLAYKNQQI